MPRRRAPSPRFALGSVFFLNGAVLSSWAPRIPSVTDDLGLSEPALGIALLGIAAGSVPTLLATGRLLRSVSPRAVCRIASLLFAGTLPLIGLADDLVTLTAALVVIGAASGALDVAMNTAAAGMERREHRHLMPGFHGAYSGGVLTGATTGGVAAAASLAVGTHFVLVTVALLALLAAVWWRLPDVGVGAPSPGTPSSASTPGPASTEAHSTTRTTTTAAPARAYLLLLVPLAIAALLLEGVVTDWSAVLAANPPFDSATVSAAVVAVFSAAMMISRAGAAAVLRRCGERRVVVTSSVALIVVLPLSVLQPDPRLLLAGLVIAGLAIGPLFPMVMSAAGSRTARDPATSTARVTACGYLAYLGGPPLVGFLAGAVGLPVALAITAATAAAVLLVLGRIGLDTGARGADDPVADDVGVPSTTTG